MESKVVDGLDHVSDCDETGNNEHYDEEGVFVDIVRLPDGSEGADKHKSKSFYGKEGVVSELSGITEKLLNKKSSDF